MRAEYKSNERYMVLRPKGRRIGFRVFDRTAEREIATVFEEPDAYRVARALNGGAIRFTNEDFRWDGKGLFFREKRLVGIDEVTQELVVDYPTLHELAGKPEKGRK